MTPAQLLSDAFTRTHEGVRELLDGLSADQVHWKPSEATNPIGWTTWHLLRVQDDHVAGVADSEQVWISGGFHDRFDLPYPPDATGYGMEPREVGAYEAPVDLLLEYADAVNERTQEYLRTLEPEDLDRIVDENWNPPVTLGVRLNSVVDDDAQHRGQIGYIRGLLNV